MKTKQSYEFCVSVLSELLRDNPEDLKSAVTNKINEFNLNRESASNDMVESVLESHRVLCEVKNMGENDAFGHNPAILYSLALSGECGELANCIIKIARVWGSQEEMKKAIESELADVFLYAILLAHTNGININELVAKKAKIVAERARNGYYGGKIK